MNIITPEEAEYYYSQLQLQAEIKTINDFILKNYNGTPLEYSVPSVECVRELRRSGWKVTFHRGDGEIARMTKLGIVFDKVFGLRKFIIISKPKSK